VERVVRLDTTSDASPRFFISADDYRQAEARATGSGQTVLGFYYSHADRPATPTHADAEQVWPDLSYVILSIRDGRAEQLRSWRVQADRHAFEEERITRV